MTLSTRRVKFWALALTVIAAAAVLILAAWYGKTWLNRWAVAPTPAQDVAAELARYAQQEKAFGRRGPIFEQAVLKIDHYGLKWSETEVVAALGTPDGMDRTPDGDFLLYQYSQASPGDSIAIIKLVNGTISLIGYNAASERNQVPWVPYQPLGSPTSAQSATAP